MMMIIIIMMMMIMMMIIIIIIIIIYMVDIKLYAATNSQLKELLRITQTFSRDIKIVFGIEKCKTLSNAKGKQEMRNFTTEDDDDTMEAMNKDEVCR